MGCMGAPDIFLATFLKKLFKKFMYQLPFVIEVVVPYNVIWLKKRIPAVYEVQILAAVQHPTTYRGICRYVLKSN